MNHGGQNVSIAKSKITGDVANVKAQGEELCQRRFRAFRGLLCEYVAFSVALGRSHGFMEKELGLDWIVHAKVTARRLVDFQAYIPRVTIETVNI